MNRYDYLNTIAVKIFVVAFIAFFFTACAPKNSAPPYCPSNEKIPQASGAPTVLVIGDSISIGYTTPTIQSTLVNYDVVHNPCNALNSTWTLSQIDGWLSGRNTFEAITWNNGLWDIASWSAVSQTDYRANLHAIAAKIKTKTAHPLFVLTTFVPAGIEGRSNADVLAYNAIATQVMAQENIPVLDLYSFSLTILNEQKPGDVHWTPAGSALLGGQVLNDLNTLYGVH